jgi:CRP-like cAMP-binding protein
MNMALASSSRSAPAIRALQALADLGTSDRAALDGAIAGSRIFSSRQEIVSEGGAIAQPLLMLDGWAYRMNLLADGRRQIIQFLLPGDLISGFDTASAPATVVALTRTQVCPAPVAGEDTPGLLQAYAAARALDQQYLFRQITRLGRLSAYERLVDWFCEMHERLSRSQSCGSDAMMLPVTQELIADTLGLTNVHINRTLQALRRDGIIETVGKTIRLLNHTACRTIAGHRSR